jgi:hypothetical protein
MLAAIGKPSGSIEPAGPGPVQLSQPITGVIPRWRQERGPTAQGLEGRGAQVLEIQAYLEGQPVVRWGHQPGSERTRLLLGCYERKSAAPK